jgi:threonine/homoserine/homoserine lactone efflux protein
MLMLLFFGVGVAAGAGTGVPIGPVNVAVIDAAYRHTLRRALATGLGGACADCLYSALGVLGVTPVLRTYPSVLTALYAVSGLILLVYGFLTARSQPVKPAHPTDAPALPRANNEVWSGFTTGLALIVLNPAAVVTWVVIMGSVVSEVTSEAPTVLEGLGCAIGVFVGSFGWFALVAYLTHKGKHVLGEKAAWIPRVIGIALMVYAVFLIARAVQIVRA